TVRGALGLPDRQNVSYQYGDGVAADVQAVTALRDGSGNLATFTYDRAGNLNERAVPGWDGLSTQDLYDTNDPVRRVPHSAGATEQYYYDHNRHRFLAVDSSGGWRLYLGELEIDHYPTKEQRSSYVQAGGESIARLTFCSGACADSPPQVTLLHHDRRGDL